MKANFPEVIPIKGRVRLCLELLKSQDIQGKMIVNVGSSFGWLEKEIQDSSAEEVIGIEINDEALEFAKANVPRVKFLQQKADRLPVEDSFADIVTLFDVIEHIDDEENMFLEISRILKKNGILVLTTPNLHLLANLLDPAWYFGHRHYKPTQILSLLSSSGFTTLDYGVRGGFWSVVYLLWFGFAKHILKVKHPRSTFLEDLDDKSFSTKNGFQTIFAIAKK